YFRPVFLQINKPRRQYHHRKYPGQIDAEHKLLMDSYGKYLQLEPGVGSPKSHKDVKPQYHPEQYFLRMFRAMLAAKQRLLFYQWSAIHIVHRHHLPIAMNGFDCHRLIEEASILHVLPPDAIQASLSADSMPFCKSHRVKISFYHKA